MIKGKITIDLHNHNSGFTERIEKENMITNAIGDAMGVWFGGGGSPAEILPIASKLLGGIMLFDGPLTERADNTCFPGKDAHLVGYALQDTNSTNPIRGSFNALESGATSTGFRSVWDFGTSQANGKINSLARTSCANNEYNNYLLSFRALNSGFSNAFNWNSLPIYYTDDGTVLCADKHDGTSKIVLRELYMPISKFKVGDGIGSARVISDTEIDLPNNLIGAFKSGYDGYAYYTYVNTGNETGDGVFMYRRIDANNKELDPSVYSVTVKDGHFSALTNGENVICNGYAYIISYDKRSIYVVDLARPTTVHNVPIPDGVNIYSYGGYNKLCTLPNGGIVVQLYDYKTGLIHPLVIYEDGETVEDIDTKPTSNTGYSTFTFSAMGGGMLMGTKTNNVFSYVMGAYLGTIANLPSEVEKTPQTSMKITYTLTDSE